MEGINISENKENKSYKWLIYVIIGLVAIYLVGVVIFSNITLPNTSINGRDVSYASKASVLDESVTDFDVDIEGRDNKNLRFNVSEIDYLATLPKDASIDQNSFSWPLAFINKDGQKYTFDYQVKYDEEKLDQILKSSSFMQNVIEPEDAKVQYSDGNFEIVKEVLGNKISYDNLKKIVVEAIKNMDQSEVEIADASYENPSVTADDDKIKNELEQANTIKDLSYSFNINGYDKKLEGEELISMFDSNKGNYEINRDKLTAYVEKIASETDTYGKYRKFKATGVGEITVNPGVYGFILDVDETANSVYELVEARKSGTIEPSYERRGYTRKDDGTDIGDTYIEVDLSRQHMWYYKDGSLVFESDVVSGNLSENALTNVGVGSIQSKSTDAVLKGTDFDGSSKYETPVNYWIPIGWDGEGLHDAPWRSSFGGEIYKTDGSHGCLNMPPAIAKRIFEEVDYNTPVIVYESTTNYSPQMSY